MHDGKLQLLCWNCEGIKRVLETTVEEDWRGLDVVVLTETFAVEEFTIGGYRGYHALAEKPVGRGRPVGGVSILVREELIRGSLRRRGTNSLVLGMLGWDLIAIYCSPSMSIDDVIELLLVCWGECEAQEIVIMGDLNCRLDKMEDNRTVELLRALDELGMKVHNDVSLPTYLDGMGGSSVIDIVAAVTHVLQVDTPVYCLGRSMSVLRKHIPIVVGVKSSTDQENQQERVVRRRRIDVDIMKLGKLVTDVDWAEAAALDSEGMWSLINELLQKAAKVRVEKETRRAKPWFNRECWERRRAAMQALELSRCHPEMRRLYVMLRKEYRRTLELAKREFLRRRECEWLGEVRSAPHKALWGKRRTVCRVEEETLREHFCNILAAEDTVPRRNSNDGEEVAEPIKVLTAVTDEPLSLEEVGIKMQRLNIKKASGIDGVTNKVLRKAATTWTLWTGLFNQCLLEGKLPRVWKTSSLVVIPKGKGNPSLPSAWRGIALKSCPYKVFTSLVADRVQWLAECSSAIPVEQHGFVVGRSTATAVDILMEELERSWQKGGKPTYAIFVDFKAAFDRASRKEIFRIIKEMGAGVRLRTILQEILQEDNVIIFNGEREFNPIRQTTGVAQGDCLSPLLFVLLLGAFPKVLREEVRSVRVLMYADDIVLYGTERLAVQMGMRVLEEYCQGKGLYINEEKTVAVKFRAGGRVGKKDKFWVNGKQIGMAKEVTYLGVRLSCQGSIDSHVRERVRKAKIAIARIRKPHLLSIKTAMAVFSLCVGPVAYYGLAAVWERMSVRLLGMVETVKASFLKRCLGVARSTKNRLVYSLLEERSFIEELLPILKVRCTLAVDEYLRAFKKKVEGVAVDGFWEGSPALDRDEWRGAGRPGRSLIIRVSLHGLHGDICSSRRCFIASEDCICKFCGGVCEQMHIWSCTMEQVVQMRRNVYVAGRLSEFEDANVSFL